MIEFIKWCFRNENSTVVTLIVMSGVGYFVLDFIKTMKKK